MGFAVMMMLLPLQAWTTPLANGSPLKGPELIEPEDQESERFARTAELFSQGMERFEREDYAGAIDLWQQAYDLVTLRDRINLFVPLGHAHWRAYQTDGDQEHLRQAQKMFERGVEALGAWEHHTRRDVEVELNAVEAELARLKAKREKQQRDQAVREAVERERRRQRRDELAKRKADEERRRFRLSLGVGGAATGLGVISLTAMTAGLGLGARVNRLGAESVAKGGSPEDRQTLRVKGMAYNRTAWTAGAVGSALMVTGATVLVLVVRQHRKFRDKQQARLGSSRHRLEVRF